MSLITALIRRKLFVVLLLIAQPIVSVTSLTYIDSFAITVPCFLWVSLHCFVLFAGWELIGAESNTFESYEKPTFQYRLYSFIFYSTLAITCLTLLKGTVKLLAYLTSGVCM